TINQPMKRACVLALADMARRDAQFGQDYIVPGLLDKRLLTDVTPKIATAAYDSGVARQYLNEGEYFAQLEELATTLI
ncbi:MAG: malic enzyme, partial [Burkholderiaceae bacterium]